MKRSCCILLAVLLLVSAALSEGYSGGSPWINPELPGNLPDARPALEDHFYLHVNYDQHQQASTNAHAAESAVARARQEMKDRIWTLVETGNSTEAKALRILTALIMDAERREKDGLEPLMAYVRRVRATQSTAELSALCREPGVLISSPYATIQLAKSSEAPARFALGLFLREIVPMQDIPEDATSDFTVQPDLARVEKELLLAGYDADSARRLAERIAQFQQDSQTVLSQDDAFDDPFDVKLTTAEEIRSLCVPLYDQLTSLGLTGEAARAVFMNYDAQSFRYIQKQYTEENLELFQAIVCLSMLRYAVDYLDPATYVKAHGIDGAPDLKEIAYEYMTGPATYLTEQAYADAYISAAQRAEVMALTDQIRQCLAEWMQQCGWLSDASKQRLAEKAQMMKAVVVTPDERTDYGPLLNALSADGISLLQAAAQADLTVWRTLLSLAGQPFDRGSRYDYSSTMIDVNAEYESGKNTLYIMTGTLLPEFYRPDSRETLLATIGQTISHEMGHGFDPNGIQRDAEGGNHCVLTEEDLPRYEERARLLAENLSRISLADGLQVNGMHNLCEEAADLMAMRLMLELAQKTEGFDYDLFFRTMARKFFRSHKTPADAISYYESDTHPAGYIRTNYTFAQFEEFYRTYPAVREGTPMYYAPETRQRLW